jgi:hypothetical protein
MNHDEQKAYDATIRLWHDCGGFVTDPDPERLAMLVRNELHYGRNVSDDESAAILSGTKLAAFCIGCGIDAMPYHEARQQKDKWKGLIDKARKIA